MNLTKLYVFQTREYSTPHSREEVRNLIVDHFHLNRKWKWPSGWRDFFFITVYPFKGKYANDKFEMQGSGLHQFGNSNNPWRLTQINGEVREGDLYLKIYLKGQIALEVRIILISQLIVSAILICTGNIFALFFILCMAYAFYFIKNQIRKDFEWFEAEFKMALNVWPEKA